MNVFMFSGQGSQYFQMGRDLFEKNPRFKRRLISLDETARSLVGGSVLDAVFDPERGASDAFDDLQISSLAIFMLEHAIGLTLEDEGVKPDLLLGVSMGSFAAATMAGCLEPELAMRILSRHAEIVKRHCRPGGMIAILGESVAIDPALYEGAVIASRNSAAHIVVSAPEELLQQIETRLRAAAAAHQRLSVRFPFHSHWIDGARDYYCDYLRSQTFRPARRPILCCATGTSRWHIEPEYFWNVARQPIEFRRTLAYAESIGPHRYIDAGPSGSLSALARHVLGPDTQSSVFPTVTPFRRDCENIARLVERCRPHMALPA